MPLYEYSCACGKHFDVFKKLAELDIPEYCACGGLSQRLISAVAVRGDYPPYECPVTGEWIEGRRAHEENLKRTGCRVYEPGETDSFLKRKARDNEAFLDEIGEDAARMVDAMPAAKKEALAAELAAGADIAVQRGVGGV